MGVDKVIFRAFISTLLAIVALIAFMIGALCLVFPSTMMEITYDLGMEKSSIHFAERAYKRSDDVYYIAYATEVAIERESADKIVEDGDKFIADDKFSVYCDDKGGIYEQYIYGQVVLAKYEKGDKSSAVATAFDAVKEAFPENNAVVALAVTALRANDGETVLRIHSEMLKMQDSVADADKAYFNEILALTE